VELRLLEPARGLQTRAVLEAIVGDFTQPPFRVVPLGVGFAICIGRSRSLSVAGLAFGDAFKLVPT